MDKKQIVLSASVSKHHIEKSNKIQLNKRIVDCELMYHYADEIDAYRERIPTEMFDYNNYTTIFHWLIWFYSIHGRRTDHDVRKKYIPMELRVDFFHKLERVPSKRSHWWWSTIFARRINWVKYSRTNRLSSREQNLSQTMEDNRRKQMKIDRRHLFILKTSRKRNATNVSQIIKVFESR